MDNSRYFLFIDSFVKIIRIFYLFEKIYIEFIIFTNDSNNKFIKQ